jgi:hypothetical protein
MSLSLKHKTPVKYQTEMNRVCDERIDKVNYDNSKDVGLFSMV